MRRAARCDMVVGCGETGEYGGWVCAVQTGGGGDQECSARAAAAAVVPFIHYASTPPGGLSRTELQLLVVLETSTFTAIEERCPLHHSGAMAMQSSWSFVVVTQPRAPPQHRHRSEPLLSRSISSC
jgi:hypothetical protein